MGDLVLTCTGSLSRNRTLGYAIGEGRSTQEATNRSTDKSPKGIIRRKRYASGRTDEVEMPICETVARTG